MTDQEKLDRMKEISKEIYRLAEEANEYGKYFEEKHSDIIRKSREYLEGKYFKKSYRCDEENTNNEIIAFKIISVTNTYHNDSKYAKCLVLVDDSLHFEITITCLSLWGTYTSGVDGSKRQMIDDFVDIGEEEFFKILEEFNEKFSSEASIALSGKPLK